MLGKCTEKVAKWLVSVQVVDKDEEELYAYALYSALFSFSPLMLTLAVGVIVGKTIQSIFMILPFFFIRKFSGGYHLKRPGICFFVSILLLILCIYLTGVIPYGWGGYFSQYVQ